MLHAEEISPGSSWSNEKAEAHEGNEGPGPLACQGTDCGRPWASHKDVKLLLAGFVVTVKMFKDESGPGNSSFLQYKPKNPRGR